jgi:glycosyltransferase involved in cell wall biosynthesis
MTIKIGFISDAVFPWHIGGLEKTEYVEASKLAKNINYNVSFVCGRWKGMKKEFKKDNIFYTTIMKMDEDTFYKNKKRSLLTSFLFSLNMFKLFKYKFDIIEVNFFPIIHIPIIKLYSKIRGCKIILDVAEVWDKKYWIDYLGYFLGTLAHYYMKFVIKMGDAYIVNSSITANRLKEIRINEDKINIYSPIIEIKEIKKIKNRIKNKKMQIIYAGRFIKEKRLDIFIDVIEKVYKKNNLVKAKLIGTGPEKENLKEIIKEKNLEKIIEIKEPYEKQEDVFYEIANSSATFLPSEREGLSALTIESIALGTPVILPNYTPVPKEVRDMCIVEELDKIPILINKILLDKNKSKYIRNIKNLNMFSISRINKFYKNLFKKTLKK